MLYEMIVTGLAMDPGSNAPILILNSKDKDKDFSVPIWIGLLEAAAIASVIQDIKFERPMTHDLFKTFIHEANVSVERIEICDLKDSTFFAKIYCAKPDGHFILDARPSDAVAIALRTGADIFVDDRVVKQLQVDNSDFEVVDTSDQGKKWAEYLKNLSPDDFGKYKV